MRGTPAERFLAMVDKTETCWLWTGRIMLNGYAGFYWNGSNTTAHRFAHANFVGPIPDDYQVDHLCRVRHCVNPSHLEAVTAQENTRRARSLITSCPRGHEYDEANTYLYKNRRGCRACRTAQMAALRQIRRQYAQPVVSSRRMRSVAS